MDLLSTGISWAKPPTEEAAAIEAHLLKQPHWVDTQEVFSLHSTITYNQSLIWIKLGCKLVKTDIAGIAIAFNLNGDKTALFLQHVIDLTTGFGPPIVHFVITGICIAHDMRTYGGLEQAAPEGTVLNRFGKRFNAINVLQGIIIDLMLGDAALFSRKVNSVFVQSADQTGLRQKVQVTSYGCRIAGIL